MRPRRTFAALLLGPCLVSACGGGGSSVADSPVSGTPTSSAPATQPPAHESPQHFIRRWADAEKRMENTGKTGAYSRLIDHCQACECLIADVRRFYAMGGYIRWKGLVVNSVAVNTRLDSGRVVYEVKTDSAPTTYRESANGPVKTLKGGVTKELVTLERSRGHYRVTARARFAR
jgi:hypothetical protein